MGLTSNRSCDHGDTLRRDLSEELREGVVHYAVAMLDPEDNEFDINERPLLLRDTRSSSKWSTLQTWQSEHCEVHIFEGRRTR